MRRLLTLLAFFAASTVGLSTAQADCAPGPTACFCTSAEYVVTGSVVDLADDTARIEVATVDVSDGADAPKRRVGEIVRIAPYVFDPSLAEGDRVIYAAYDGELSDVATGMRVDDGGNAQCQYAEPNVSLSVQESRELMLAELTTCHDRAPNFGLETRPCNDTVTSPFSCSMARRPHPTTQSQPTPAGAVGISAGLILLAFSRRRRSARY